MPSVPGRFLRRSHLPFGNSWGGRVGRVLFLAAFLVVTCSLPSLLNHPLPRRICFHDPVVFRVLDHLELGGLDRRRVLVKSPPEVAPLALEAEEYVDGGDARNHVDESVRDFRRRHVETELARDR